MGKNTKTSLADALFSQTQQRVLSLLFGQPGRSFYTSEIIARVGAGRGSVQRELAKLSESGLVTVAEIGNQRHYQANPSSPIFSELRGIVEKTFGLADVLRAALAPLSDQLRAAFIYGSTASHSDTASSDIDLLIISDELSYSDLFSALSAAEAHLGRSINPTCYTLKDFSARRTAENSFITRVLERPKIWLFGGEDALST